MRDTIKNILQSIPGYEGYAAKERRRDADKTLRMNLAQQFKGERQTITRLTQKATDSGKFQYLEHIEETGQRLDHFIARLQSAPRGYASWFSDAAIDEADLDLLYDFDAKLADSIALLREHVEYAEQALKSGEAVDDALDSLRVFVNGLHAQFDARQEFVSLGKRPL